MSSSSRVSGNQMNCLFGFSYQFSTYDSILPAVLSFTFTTTLTKSILVAYFDDYSVNRYPVQAGDVIWMAPFVPQWWVRKEMHNYWFPFNLQGTFFFLFPHCNVTKANRFVMQFATSTGMLHWVKAGHDICCTKMWIEIHCSHIYR